MNRKFFLIMPLVALGAWWGFHPKTDHSQTSYSRQTIPPVSAATASRGDMPVYLQGIGNVIPLETVVLHTRVDGQLMRVLYREGQFVHKDELLAELDARPFEAQLEQAEGQKKRDEALLAEARVDLERYRTLYAQDSIAKQQLDLQASLVKQYEGATQNDQGQIDNAKIQIAYTRITAPFPGNMGLRLVDSGNIVHVSDANGLATITRLEPITVIFTLPEDVIPQVMEKVHKGDHLLVEAYDREGKRKLATGMLLAVDNQVDQTTGAIKLRAEFPNENRALYPSQFVNVKCRLEVQKGVLTVPSSAVLHGASGYFVYVLKADHTVAMRPVQSGANEGDMTVITDGLAEGEQVITDGTDNLRDGVKVTLAGQPSAPPVSTQPTKKP